MSVKRKFLLSVLSIIVVMVILGTIVTSVSQTQQLKQEAQQLSALQAAEISQLLTVTDSLMMDRVKSGMQVLIKRGQGLGDPRRGSSTTVGDRSVPALYLGDEQQSNRYELVDELTSDMGGTATLFVYDGENYVRVSTNVKKAGQRATGTILNPKGAAFAAIESGEPFYGQVDILGSPYLTGYEPMRNATGDVVGIWYVGYSADLTFLEQSIAQSVIFEDGFTALLDDQERVRMHSSNQSSETVERILGGEDDGWTITHADFSPWGYKVVTAYSDDELTMMTTELTLTIAGMIVVVGGLIILAISPLVTWVISRPMQRLIDAINNITQGEGDLTVRLPVGGKDEFGQVAEGFNALLAKVQNTIKEVSNSSRELLVSAEAMVASAEQSSHYTEQQAGNTEQVASAMNQMLLSAQSVAEGAADADQSARGASEQAASGRASLQETITIIGELTQNTIECAEDVIELEAHSDAISGVLDVIHGIAEQTNLLALNAAIEAARAGEHGRGFAVVSDEVRSLANRTQNSITDIREQIERLQTGSRETARKMEANRTQSQEVSTKASESGEAVDAVAAAMSDIAARNTDIASAAEEQSRVCDEINVTLERIRGSAQDTSAQAEQARHASNNLIDLAKRLRQQLEAYRV